MTVTAASAANLHFAFNRAEEKIRNPGYFKDARKEINQGVYILIVLFLVAVSTFIVRSYFLDKMVLVSLLNGTGLVNFIDKCFSFDRCNCDSIRYTTFIQKI